jgi:2-polyprenyl-3-methyl-5-hydroxy-6-metoxy-1,4-benzoquinol methylase
MVSKRKTLQTDIISALKEFATTTSYEDIEETAIPSYIHPNPLVRAIFWGRVYCILGAIEKLGAKASLDFGCGSGIITSHLSPDSERSVMDIYYSPLEFMKKKLGVLRNVKQLNAKDLLGLKAEFDVVIAADVLEHFQPADLPEQVRAFHGWLQSGGHVVISGPTENVLYRIGRSVAGYSGHYHHMTIKDIDKVVVGSSLFACVSKVRYPIPFLLEGFLVLTYKRLDNA